MSTNPGYLSEFGDDPGTWWPSAGEGVRVAQMVTPGQSLRRELRKRVSGLPIVWAIDDERSSRAWFVQHHRQHWALITFSSREHAVEALRVDVPCDIVITDVFFPAKTPNTLAEEQVLLSIYDKIEATTIAKLPNLWADVRNSWQLHGFTVAQDVVEWARRRKRVIPVILYSRKAPLLLDDNEWLADAAAVRNTHWMTEKIDPSGAVDVTRRIVGIQRNRVNALLNLTQRSAPWWMKALSGLGVKIGPFEYSLARLAGSD